MNPGRKVAELSVKVYRQGSGAAVVRLDMDGTVEDVITGIHDAIRHVAESQNVPFERVIDALRSVHKILAAPGATTYVPDAEETIEPEKR